MLRRLHKEQPLAFAFTPANLAWAEGQITKYPEGRQASAIIPLLWRAQEQEGWLSRPAIEHVADMLGLAYIRALEVATFYFMFHLQPVGKIAHIQVCGTTSCMITGAEDLVGICQGRIAQSAHTLSADGNFSWEEVECLGACSNAPMAQIGKDYYEDLTPERLAWILDEMAAGRVPVPGPQNGRYAAEPLSGLTSLVEFESGRRQYNASAQGAVDLGDTIARIDGTEVALTTPWLGRTNSAPKSPARAAPKSPARAAKEPRPAEGRPADATGATVQEAVAVATGKPEARGPKGSRTAPGGAAAATATGTGTATGNIGIGRRAAAKSAPGTRPAALTAARGGTPDDLKEIVGVGPKLEMMLHRLGFFHFDQIAAWTAAEIAWVDDNLDGFKGRVTREGWVAQAGQLAARAGRG